MNSSYNTQLTEIDAISLKQKLDLQEVILVDVRESGEYATEHIVGSIRHFAQKKELTEKQVVASNRWAEETDNLLAFIRKIANCSATV